MKQVDAEKLIKQRVLDALNECKVSVNKLAASFGARQTTLNDQINGSSKISAATLLALAEFCPDVSAEWLLRGNGDMLISQPQHETHTRDIRDDNEVIAALNRTIEIQEREIAGLYERIKELKGAIVMPHRSAETV